MEDVTQAFRMGRDAYWNNLDLDDNPFQEDDEAWENGDWEKGWLDAQDEVGDSELPDDVNEFGSIISE